ncbi:hypothetical protein TSOC_006334 [Tetrabaena socialis]|uniref:Uncharacterized protein n=1 Tax=Tetrabaena socialis TaxID=47790 RepID=A0A2J8A3Z8_9CHLO|nr:hypothetical protein TSOC_006334 [Tetrabaena socialis]|eukprot:PNH07250.1 hypothetical protein TSOC_006334 [Tetrabaena socialis]
MRSLVAGPLRSPVAGPFCGRCPFTKQPLTAEALTVLNKNNIERYRSRIQQ